MTTLPQAADTCMSPGNTTYYVDPVSGDDAQRGTEPASAWRTFTPVNRLTFAPGDALEILSPGAFTETLVLTGAGTEASPVTVSLTLTPAKASASCCST